MKQFNILAVSQLSRNFALNHKYRQTEQMKIRILTLFTLLVFAIPALPQMKVTHPWSGKRVAYFGDSITDPKNKASKQKYWNFLQEWLGITPYVYGRSGRQWNDIPRQADLLQKEHGDDFDAIMIFMGTNDFNAGVPVGQWYTEKMDKVLAAVHAPKDSVMRLKRSFVYSDSTFCGRINKAMALLKKRWPTKQIVVLTPIHRAYFYGSETNIQPTEEYQNKCGEYFSTYVEKVKEVSNVWAVPVIDVNATSGLYSVFDETAVNYHNLANDRLHPNDHGQMRLARTLEYQLLALPCVF